MQDPVVPLRLALYGHPDAGGYWEKHCHLHLTKRGFKLIEDWRSCYYHPELRLFLVVYVDDFKMAGPEGNLGPGWKLIREGIKIEDPAPVRCFLGCNQHVYKINLGECLKRLGLTPKCIAVDADPRTEVQATEYEMKEYPQQSTDHNLKVTGTVRTKLRRVETPYLAENEHPSDCSHEDGNPMNPLSHVVGGAMKCSVSKDKSRAVSEGGTLQAHAATVLMKILYPARLCRWDLIRPTCALASRITKWDRICDKALHKLVCYIHSTPDKVQLAFIGDRLLTELALYADGDLAGCKLSQRSTSGVFMALAGPHSFFPAACLCKKQTANSNCTPESELVAAWLAIRTIGLPSLNL